MREVGFDEVGLKTDNEVSVIAMAEQVKQRPR